jgi:hypothetical protein
MYDADDLLSPTEAARLVGCSVNTISRAAKRAGLGLLLANGRLVAIRFADLRTAASFTRDCGGVNVPAR